MAFFIKAVSQLTSPRPKIMDDTKCWIMYTIHIIYEIKFYLSKIIIKAVSQHSSKEGKISIPRENTWLQLPGAAHKSTTRFTPVDQILIKELKVRYVLKS